MSNKRKQNRKVFFALLRAGLWEEDVHLVSLKNIDFSEILRLAEEQTVVGLVAAGIEHVIDVKPTQKDILTFVSHTIRLERLNTAMNNFIAVLIKKLRVKGICTLLVKGQGIAQCYERPLWRTCGDIDLFLDKDNYSKAKEFLVPLAHSVDTENKERMHLEMEIDSWIVELHGTLHGPLFKHVDQVLDEVQQDTFANKQIRVWKNDSTDVYLPSPNNDLIFVFTHILEHYFSYGIGLRQLCDWCRLLSTYHEEIDAKLLEHRLRSMRIMTEWQVFCAYAIKYLGAKTETMHLFQPRKLWVFKAIILNHMIMVRGNFGHNRGYAYSQKYPYLVRKTISFRYRLTDALCNLLIFPRDSIATFYAIFKGGIKAVIKHKK